MARLPFLLSIVHGGSVLPRELAPRLALSPADVFFDSDPWTREIFALGELVQGRLEVEVARAVIDLDKDPSLRPSAVEDGVVRLKTRYGKTVWTESGVPTADDVTKLIDRYHRPYHDILERTASRGGVRLGIDCHSMAPIGAPLDPDPGEVRPLFSLGNMGDAEGNGEWTTCDADLLLNMAEALQAEFKDLELPEGKPLVAFNAPYSGGFILKRHRRDRQKRGTPWIRFTINRSLLLKDEPEDPALAEAVPDSDREVIAKLRIRILNAFRMFARKLQ